MHNVDFNEWRHASGSPILGQVKGAFISLKIMLSRIEIIETGSPKDTYLGSKKFNVIFIFAEWQFSSGNFQFNPLDLFHIIHGHNF